MHRLNAAVAARDTVKGVQKTDDGGRTVSFRSKNTRYARPLHLNASQWLCINGVFLHLLMYAATSKLLTFRRPFLCLHVTGVSQKELHKSPLPQPYRKQRTSLRSAAQARKLFDTEYKIATSTKWYICRPMSYHSAVKPKQLPLAWLTPWA